MKFNRSTLFVGEGRLCGAVERGGGINFFIDSDGSIIKKSMETGRRGIKNEGFVSFAQEYTETAAVLVERFGDDLDIKKL